MAKNDIKIEEVTSKKEEEEKPKKTYFVLK